MDADAYSFRSGVTTMVDTGTAGPRHLRHFKQTVIDRAKTRILAYVNIVNQGMLATLSVGSCADVAVFQLHSGSFGFVDCGRAKITGDKKLECALTIRNGAVVYDVGGLSMPHWTEAPAAYWGR